MERIVKIIVGTLVFFLVFEIIQVGAQNVGASCDPTDNCSPIFHEECDGAVCVCMTGYEANGVICSAVNCPVLNAIANGANIAYSNAQQYESTAIYTCLAGYDAVGDSSRQCQATKVWSGTEPSCNKKDCGALTAPTNGQKDNTLTTYGETVTFTCDTGYTMDGTATLTCDEDGTWSGTPPTCNIVDCGTETSPANGVVSGTSTVYQSTITYSCSTGYDLTGGSATRTCQADGQWSDTSPACIIKDCGDIGTLTDGTVSYSSGTTFNSIATAACITGHDLLGQDTFLCQEDPVWSGTLPTCSIRDCGTLPSLINGQQTITAGAGTTYASQVTFNCNTGYTLMGITSINCQADGSWDSNTQPTCQVKDCGTLTAPVNGAVTYNSGTQEYNTFATFTCNTGYSLGGTSPVLCLADASWSGTTPTCTIADCGVLTQPTNGQVFYSELYQYDSTASFSCNNGYTLNGESSLKCQQNGQWNANEPFCAINICPELTVPAHGTIITQTGTTFGDQATFNCDVGYTLVGTASLTCQASGAWDDTEPTCDIKVCPTVTAPTDGSIIDSTGTSYGSKVEFSCDEGYQLFGSVTILCQQTASWSGTLPTCQIKDCGSIGTPDNGQLSTADTIFGTSVTISCDTGYTLTGSSTSDCTADGTWSSAAPTCDIVDCGDLTTPASGNKDATTTTYGSSTTFTCFEGYTLTGSASSTCQADGSWSQLPPTCVIKDCGGLTAPTNGNLNPASLTTYGTAVTFSCDTGYVLTGSAILNCENTGSWSSTEPLCVIQDCGAPSPPSDGSVVHAGGTMYEAIATYSCDTGYTRVGPETRKCQADGSWSATEPTCEIVDCGALAAPSDGNLTPSGGTVYQAVAFYSCNLGYTHTGTNSRTCQADFTWSLTAPTCVIKDCGTLTAPTNGTIDLTSGTTYGEEAKYTCDIGFTRVGVESRTCQDNGDWSSTKPVCNINICGSLFAPTNGYVDLAEGYLYLSVAYFSCEPGYDLTGDTSRSCLADGTWQTPSPTCIIKDCGGLLNPADGLVDTASGTVYRSVATYSCIAGYEIVGSETRTCVATGTWNSTAPTCTRKDCGTLAAPLNGSVDLSQGTLYEADATFACDVGFTLVGVTVRTCEDSGSWGLTSPLCQINDCGTLTGPVDGSVSTPGGTTYLEVGTFQCDPGYTLTGVTMAYCQADKSWNDTTPSCIIKDCGPLTAPDQGSVSFNPNTKYEGVAMFTCDTGYTPNGTATRECVAAGTWAGQTPGCEINVCGVLPSPSNGHVNQSDGTTYQSVSYFTCNIGYTLTGVSDRTCLANSSWSDASPDCIINDCGSISDPVNGTVDLSNGTVYQSVAVFICDIGFNLIGNITRECLAPGTWETPFAICQIKDCGTPVTPDFGFLNISGATTYQSKISYTCQDGFDLSGAVVRTCDSNGNWTDSDPLCLRRNCSFVTAADYGSVVYPTGDTLYKSVAEYKCNLGFNLTGGSQYRYCLEDTSWNGTEPVCVTQDCGSLTDPTDGQVSTPTGTTYLQIAYYTCSTGYQLNGNDTRVCEDVNGTPVWSDNAPTCTIRDCGQLVDPNLGSVDLTGGTEYAAVAQYSCITGYEVNGLVKRVCLATGDWSGEAPTCQLIDCGALANPANGAVATSSGTLYSATATYTCDTGYGLVGTATISCLDTGLWDTAPTCNIDCGIPTSVSQASVTYPNGTLAGVEAVYTCATGFSLSGGDTVTCQTSGSWSDEPFCFIELRNFNDTCFQTSQCITVAAMCRDNGGTNQCICAAQDEYYDSNIDECLADCGTLSAPSNGLISLPPVTAAGQIVYYTCDVGYALSGNAVRECQSNGVWRGSDPTCITGCASLDPPDNGYVNTTTGKVSGKTAYYTCNTGYSLVGNAERVCLDNSKWNGKTPTCHINCPTLTDINHGTVDLALGNWEGSLAVYICDEDYGLVGPATRTCQTTGIWTGVEPECIFAIFPDILLVFGSLFVFLFIVDLAILGFCLYLRYARQKKPKAQENNLDDLDKEEEEEMPAYPTIFDEKPPPVSIPPMLSSTTMRNSGHRTRNNARITPENAGSHPPPRKPKGDRPLYKYSKPKSEIPEPGANQKPHGHLEPMQQGMKGSQELQLEDFDRDGGMNSDDSAQRKTSAPEDDQISLFDDPAQKWESNGEAPRQGKAPTMADEVYEHGNIRARMNIPPAVPNPVNDADKSYSEERRKYLKTSINAYSQNKM